ncbi:MULTISPECIES: GNAT family N-acetyltransferase [Streptomyces]|uniref:GNAT family N-acetyltransferase n=1 Tax=Streptomyces TaxID=1883 RepID=UPI00345B968B
MDQRRLGRPDRARHHRPRLGRLTRRAPPLPRLPLFLGSRYEDIAVATLPQERGRGLATACVRALCADITARGRIPSWTCSRNNQPSRHLAAKSGLRLVHECVHYAVGSADRCPGNVL